MRFFGGTRISGSSSQLDLPQWHKDVLYMTTLNGLNNREKNVLLQNSGYLYGIRVDGVDGPRRTMRPVAMPKTTNAGPFVQEVDDTLTEIVTAHNERQANYVHQGWSHTAASMIPPWAACRMANKNQPNPGGVWITKRTVLQRLTFSMLFEDLAPVPAFEADIRTALEKPTLTEKFQALHKVFHEWGDVVPLEIDVGISLSMTDSEANFAKLPSLGTDHASLLAAKTLRIAKRGGDANDLSWTISTMTIPPHQWRQVRVAEVIPTTSLLNEKLRGQLTDLHTKRISYLPPPIPGPTGGLKTHDDTNHASKTVSSVVVRCAGYVDCVLLTYRNGGESNRHGGWGGTENKFSLGDEEYITQMTAWCDDHWVYALQFRTNTGRYSPHYGGHSGRPITTSGQGGALVGFYSMVRRHGQWGDLLGRVQGIWRYDFVSSV